MSKQQPKSALPDAVSLDVMRMLLGGVTTSHINGLARQGIIEKTERGMYTLASVGDYVRWLRRVQDGPRNWQDVRTEIGREKLALLKLDQQERERRVIPVGEVRQCWTTIARTIRDKILGLASRLAPRLTGIRTAVEVEAILRPELEQCLEELANMRITMRAPNAKQQDYDERESISA